MNFKNLGFKLYIFITSFILGEKPYKLLIYLYIKCDFLKFNCWITYSYYIFHALQNFKKIKDQLLCHQINVKISNFCDLKLCIKNKFIDRIVNNIRFEQNLILMLKI